MADSLRDVLIGAGCTGGRAHLRIKVIESPANSAPDGRREAAIGPDLLLTVSRAGPA
jgi:hypothetical protein